MTHTTIPWYKRPLAFLGAMTIAYQEVFRGRRTGTCIECGRTTHASSSTCLCGGEVLENEHPSAADGGGMYEASQQDSLARLPYQYLWFFANTAGVLLVLAMLTWGVRSQDMAPALGALVLAFLFDSLPDPAAVRYDD